MPFRIIRTNLTKVHADAIVNTANPMPVFGDGTDRAIYMAAGAEELLAERRKIGAISRGEAAVTKAFRLPARFIIHTVGPVWQGGDHGEFETLRSCYRKSLLLAEQLGCESIAFPLISTGVYGFPRDKALDIALSCFREHLKDSEIDIILVVFDRKSFQLSEELVSDVEQFIDEQTVKISCRMKCLPAIFLTGQIGRDGKHIGGRLGILRLYLLQMPWKRVSVRTRLMKRNLHVLKHAGGMFQHVTA